MKQVFKDRRNWPALFLLLAIFFIWTVATAQQGNQPVSGAVAAPDCIIGPIAAASTGPSPVFDNRTSGCSIWTVEEWINSTGNPTIAVQLERADDAGGAPGSFANWPAPDIENSALGALTNMQNIDFNAGQLTYYRFYPWVRVNVTTLSANVLNYQALGYRPKFGYPTTAASGAPGNDLCANPGVRKIFSINVTSATTTAIAPVAGNASVYPCQGVITIASSATSAATAQFEFGTGTACATPTKVLTGTFGAGVVPSTGGQTALVVNIGELSPSAFANGFCIVTAGTTVNVQGYFTFIQQ